MSVLQRVVKPTTRKGKTVLIKREPQVIEGAKRALFFTGRKASDTIRGVMKDLYDLKKPDAFKMQRKNDVTVFENVTPVEQYCRKHETPLFLMGSNTKKRPDNIVLGRMFDYSLLDMIELGVDNFDAMKEFCGRKIAVGCKPLMLFNGPHWEQSDDLKQLKSMFIDFFHREDVDNIRLQGLEHALSFTVAEDGKIMFRSYRVLMKKSGCRTPRIELEEIGPRIDFTLRRTKLPTEDLMKLACRQPKSLKVKKKKNIATDGLGTTHGRVHLGKQDINKLQTRKMKGLKKSVKEQKALRNAGKSLQNGVASPLVKKMKARQTKATS